MEDFSLNVQILVQVHIVGAAGHGIEEGRRRVKGNVHVEIAVLHFLDLEAVVSNVHRVHPGVLEYSAADVDAEVSFPVDDAS